MAAAAGGQGIETDAVGSTASARSANRATIGMRHSHTSELRSTVCLCTRDRQRRTIAPQAESLAMRECDSRMSALGRKRTLAARLRAVPAERPYMDSPSAASILHPAPESTAHVYPASFCIAARCWALMGYSRAGSQSLSRAYAPGHSGFCRRRSDRFAICRLFAIVWAPRYQAAASSG